MRWSPVSLLLLVAAPLAASADLPNGNRDFQLACTRAQLDSALSARGAEVISRGLTHVSCAGQGHGVEYEQYDFTPSAGGDGRLWRVTIAFRVPYARADFDSLQTQLVVDLGEPTETTEPAANDPFGVHKVSWVDARTAVQLAGRWPERPDPRADRMLLTWTDRRLQKLVDAQHRVKPKTK